MRRHPSAGVEMLAYIDFPWDVRPIIESHHERWDGGGYPSGLVGEAIPLSARILCVADVYDALTSLRSYRRALSHDEAMEIMRRDVGTAFDPEVFVLFEETVAKVQAQVGADTPHVVVTPISSAAIPRVAYLEADIDGLTGLPLGPSLARIAAQVLEDRRATGGETSLVTVDLDAGAFIGTAKDDARRDHILQIVASQLKKHTRATDFVARTGDYRFVALLRDASVAEAELVASRVKAAVARIQRHLLQPRAGRVPTTVSVVTAPMNGETVDELFAAVDRDEPFLEPTT
jgi:diguanylate cyclase (GGDEF)-like protein